MSEIDLLLKLFDTLKDSSKDMQQLCHAMLTNQNNIGNYIKGLPMAELQAALKEHTKESSDEIGTCTETVTTTSSDIIEVVNGMKRKINQMILVVVVAVSLFGIALLIGGIATKTDKQTPPSFNQTMDEQNEVIKKTLKDQNEVIKGSVDSNKKVIKELIGVQQSIKKEFQEYVEDHDKNHPHK